jgi:hypothetical protein
MKKTIVSVLMGVSILGGCRVSTLPPDAAQDVFALALSQDQRDIQTVARLSTGVYLATVQNDKNRSELAHLFVNVGTKVNSVLGTDTKSLKAAQALALDLISQSDVDNKEVALLLLNELTNIVSERIQAPEFKLLSNDKKLEVGRVLVKSAVEGVVEAAQLYSK